jgi:hypothetical protein
MKTIVFTLAGAVAGVLVAAFAVYLFGASLQTLGLQLYGSEADQQRNFNIAMLLAAASAVIGGWLGYRRGHGDA